MSDKMYGTGLLLLTKPLRASRALLPAVFERLSQSVRRDVYVHLQPGLQLERMPPDTRCVTLPYTECVRRHVTDIYKQAALYPALNTRLLISNIGSSTTRQPQKHSLALPFDVILVDEPVSEGYVDGVKNFVFQVLESSSDLAKVEVVGMDLSGTGVDESQMDQSVEDDEDMDQVIETYSSVCVGGTFDRLHTGHKILLTETCALAQREVTVGVTEPNMNTKKVLNELIEPTEKRIDELSRFVRDIKPDVAYNIVPISDMYGPSVVIEALDCLVVSDETVRGGKMVNDKRREKGLQEALIHHIELVEDERHSPYEEAKISSSSSRKRLLGTLLQPAKQLGQDRRRPYVIGLTGGIASGKSSVAKQLENQGAHVIDCDKLGHRAYLKGTAAFDQIVEAFGQDVVGEDGEINRKALGPKVFAAKSELEKLNGIVWPAIAELFKKEIADSRESDVVVLDAAVLLEAGWDSCTHEVWTTVVPREEAIKRIMERNGLSEEAASRRIDSQMPNQEKVDRANVVLCTLWEYEYTHQQVVKAWRLLQERLATRQ